MRILLVLLYCFTASILFGQNLTFVFDGQISNYDSGKKEAGVTISIVKDGATVATTSTASNGRFKLKNMMPAKSKFDIVFSKSGFVSKKVSFDCSNLDDSNLKEGDDYKPLNDLSTELFLERPGTDFSFLKNEPAVAFSYNKAQRAVSFDVASAQRVKQKIERLLKEADAKTSETDEKYAALIKEADLLFDKEEYGEAKVKYLLSLQIKKEEAYPKSRIAELEVYIIAAQKDAALQVQIQKEFDSAIKEAEGLKTQNKLQDAKETYEYAYELKQEPYIQTEIQKLELAILKQAKDGEVDAKYTAALSRADKAFESKNWTVAKAAYGDAQTIRPSESYPKEQKAKVLAFEKQEGEAAMVAQKFTTALKTGDALFSQSKYNDALAKYKEASALKPDDAYVQGQIKVCQDEIAKMSSQADREANIKNLFEEGKQLTIVKKFEEAQSKYQEIISLDNNNTAARSKLAELDGLIKERDSNNNKEAEFKKLVSEGDSEAKANKISSAIDKYKQALRIQEDNVVRDKLNRLEGELSSRDAQSQVKEKYDQAMEEANSEMAKKSYASAKQLYAKAIQIDNTKDEPKDKIKEIDKILLENQSKGDLEKNYALLIQEGQNLLNDKRYAQAKDRFEKASSLKTNENLPKEKIKEINLILANQQENKELIGKVNNLITKGEFEFKNTNYTAAKSIFEEVLSLQTENALAKSRLLEIERLMKAQQNSNKADENFTQLKKEALSQVDAKKYEEALATIDKALVIRTDALLVQKKRFVQSELQKTAERDKNYNATIAKGKDYMAKENYLGAIAQFNLAGKIKPNEKEPVNLAAEAERLERAKGNEADGAFEKILIAVDNKIEAKEYDRAIELINRAKGFRPTDPRPDALLREVNRLKIAEKNYKGAIEMAQSAESEMDYLTAIKNYTAASKFKPEEALPPQKIKELTALQSEKALNYENERQFNNYFSRGNRAMDVAQHQNAIVSYEKALEFKPGNKVVQDKISEANQLIETNSANQRNLAQTNKSYDSLLRMADLIYRTEKWEKAKENYELAKTLKPKESYPVSQISKCDRWLKLAELEAIDKEYNLKIQIANAKLERRDYENAKTAYQESLELKPKSAYPTKKILEIDDILNAPVIESAELEPLGDVYEGGNTKLALEQADISRENTKNANVGDIKKASNDLNLSLQEKQTQGTRDIDQEMFKVETLNRAEAEKAKSNLNQTQNNLDAIKRVNNNINTDLSTYERGDNLRSKDKLTYVQRNVILENEIRIDGYKSKAEALRQNIDNLESRERRRSQEQQFIVNAKSAQLDAAKMEIDRRSGSDDLSRRIANESINESKIQANRISDSRSNDQYLNQLEAKYTISKTVNENEKKDFVDAENPDRNNQKLNRAESKVNQSNEYANAKYESQKIGSITKIDNVQDQIYSEDIGRDINRQNDVESIKATQTDLNVRSAEALNRETEKYRKIKKATDDQLKVLDGKSNELKEVTANNNTSLDGMKRIANAQLTATDDVDTKQAQYNQGRIDQTIAVNSEEAQMRAKDQINAQTEINNMNSKTREASAELDNKSQSAILSNESSIDQMQSEIAKRDAQAALQGDQNKALIVDLEKTASDVNDKNASNARQNQLNLATSASEIIDANETRTADNEASRLQKGNQTDNIYADINRENQSLQEQSKNRQLANQASLDKAEDPIEIIKPKNSLGSKFPEGITEEQFSQNDENGILKAIITRRIVVIDGYGDVFIRTETNLSSTYSKNGVSITEYNWQKETQNGKLVRNN
ncbi:MAG: epidermal growth factor receptor substrate 15 [Lentimonas sp.]|jgi:epidermal growth factor receptor substrate 15